MPGPDRRDDKNTQKQNEGRRGPGSSPGGAGKGPDKNSGGNAPPKTGK